jgi:hypothetical protein
VYAIKNTFRRTESANFNKEEITMSSNVILTDSNKGLMKKSVVMVIGVLFFFFCGKILFDNGAAVSRGLDMNITGVFNFLGIAAYLVSAICLIGIPAWFITGKNCQIAVYDWGIEGAGVSSVPFVFKKFKLPYDKLTKAPQCKNDLVILFSSEGKFTYHASDKTVARQICETITARKR